MYFINDTRKGEVNNNAEREKVRGKQEIMKRSRKRIMKGGNNKETKN